MTQRRPTPSRVRPGRVRREPPGLLRGPGAILALSACALLATATAAVAQGQTDGGSVPEDAEAVTRRADDARVKGDTAAPIRVLEVSDFQCPYCRRYVRETFPTVDSLYVQSGLVEYVWLAFPNPNHQRAWPAIEAAFCAGAAGSFWSMHDLLFANQGEWANASDPVSTFVEYARSLGIDAESFRSCVVEDKPSGLAIRDYGAVSQGGVEGTPFFVIADSLSFQGAQPVEKFRAVLDDVLRAKGVEPPQ